MRKILFASIALLCVCFFSSLRCNAQTLASNVVPEMPGAALVETPTPKFKPTHKFFDRENLSLTALSFSAALADGITTQHALGQHRTFTNVKNGLISTTSVSYVERNPIAAPLVNRGWAGQITATALTAGADLTLRNWAHRKGHHRIERVIPFLFAATSASFAAHNAHYW